ncbi:MAG: hypothetical protein IT378_07510 [Sandaracinaceae bacterium]|nr:hypothetical protein [Sandaracinaceae bacterium]
MRFVLTCQVEAACEEVYDLLLDADSQPRDRWSLVPGMPPERAPPSQARPARATIKDVPPRLSRFWLPLPGPITTELLLDVRPSQLAFRWTGPGMYGELVYLLATSSAGTALEQHTTLLIKNGWSALEPFVRRAFYHSAARRLERIKRCFTATSLGKPPPPDRFLAR